MSYLTKFLLCFIHTGRGIRSKLRGDSSHHVALCDLQIGYTDLAFANSNLPSNNSVIGNMTQSSSSSSSLNNAKAARSSAIAAYVSFYRCFQCAYLALGPSDPLTLEAEQLLMTHNMVNGERIVSAMELKLRIHELQWTCSSTTNWLYSVALFVGRLGEDEALTLVQIRQLVSSAIRFSISRLGSVGSSAENGNSNNRNHNNNSNNNASPARGSASPLKLDLPSLGPNSSEGEAGAAALSSTETNSTENDALSAHTDSQQEQINVITSMLMMIPKPFAATVHSPGKRSGPSSPSKSSQSHSQSEMREFKGPPKLRISGQSSSSSNNLNANSSDIDSPEVAVERPPLSMSTLKQSSMLREALSNVTNPNTESKTSTDDSGGLMVALAMEPATSPSLKGHAVKDKPEASPSKFQLKSKVLDGEEANTATASPGGAVNVSPTRQLPASWKPIRSAYHSLAWSACNTIQKVDFALGSAEAVYARDTEGVLLVLRRAAGNTIEEAQRSEQKQQLAQRKSIRKSSGAAAGGAGMAKRKSVEGKAGDEATDGKAKLGALFAKRAPPSASSGTGGGDTAVDPKAALNALFSKQGGGGGLGLKFGGPPPAASASSSGAAKAGAGPVWAKDIPFAPPIPTSWPPEPYVGEEGGGSGDAAGNAGVGGGAAAAASTIVNADGTVVAISIPVPAGPPKPKLKQIYLVGLPTVEGTLWADEGEALISVSTVCRCICISFIDCAELVGSWLQRCW